MMETSPTLSAGSDQIFPLIGEFIHDRADLEHFRVELALPLTRKQKINLIRDLVDRSGKYLKNENYEQYHLWLSGLVDLISRSRTVKAEDTAYFTHQDNIREVVIEQLRSAREDLKICMFTISDNPIAETIAGCHKQGIRVRIITDDGKTFDKGSDIYSLHNQGIQVKIDSYKSLMHHKFVIIDNQKLLTGSYNWTRTGSDINNENILITTHKKVVRAYKKEYKRLWKEMKPLPY